MKKLLLSLGLLWVSVANAQFTPGQLLTAGALNSQFALYSKLSGATFTGAVTMPSLTVTAANPSLLFQNSGTGSVARTYQSKFSDFVTVADFGTAAQAASAASGGYFLVPSGTSVTLNVPSQFSTITAALTAIQNWQIYGSVTIQVADGTYSVPGQVTLSHPFGENIHIIGDTTTPANCILNFSGTNGFYVPPGFSFGEINGFYIKNVGTKTLTTGVFTNSGTISKLGPNLTIDSFYYNISELYGGVINAAGTAGAFVTVKNGGDANIWAYQGGQINAQYAVSTGASDASNNLGFGALAEQGGVIEYTNGTATGNYIGGIAAYSNGFVRAENTSVSGNGGGVNPLGSSYSGGYIALEGGSMEVFGGSTTSNTGYGYANDPASVIAGATGITDTGNTLGTFYTPVNVTSLGYTWFNAGNVTLNGTYPGTGTGGSVYLDQNIPTSTLANQRFLTNGSEIWRQQWDNNAAVYQWRTPGGTVGLSYVPSTGVTTLKSVAMTGPIQLSVTTVSSLPTCNAGAKGQMYAVSDASSPTYNSTLTGGGAVSVPAYCNGSNWTAH